MSSTPITSALSSSEPDSIGARFAAWIAAYPTAALILGGIVLPNILSLLTLLFDIGLPPRPAAILLYASVAALARSLAFPLVVAAFLAVLAYDLVSTVALLFGLAPTEIAAALRYAGVLRIYASPLYLSLLIAIAASTVASLALLRHRDALKRASLVVTILAAAGLAALDFALHASPHYHFGSLMGRGAPVQSAADASGFARATPAARNLMLVVVEGLGELVDPAGRAAIAAPLTAPDVAARYTVTEGATTYFGSTTAAEMRELCHTREGYDALTAESGAECLPARLRRDGYDTVAVHGFSGEMFDRKHWFPLIGFDRFIAGEALLPSGRFHVCGSVFRGACDAELEQTLAAQLRGADAPTFLYWLTLNTHVPVSPGQANSNLACDGKTGATRTVCLMSELWRDVFATVATIAADPKLGTPEILIVGDHAPPLWTMSGRRMFEPGKVSWYHLTPRG